jgi:thiamine monophosphate kinase
MEKPTITVTSMSEVPISINTRAFKVQSKIKEALGETIDPLTLIVRGLDEYLLLTTYRKTKQGKIQQTIDAYLCPYVGTSENQKK